MRLPKAVTDVFEEHIYQLGWHVGKGRLVHPTRGPVLDVLGHGRDLNVLGLSRYDLSALRRGRGILNVLGGGGLVLNVPGSGRG